MSESIDILGAVRKDTDYCTYCPKMCRFSCPVAETELKETFTPTGKQTVVHLVREGNLDLTDEIVEVFFKCTGCLHCREYCLHEIDVPRSLEAARAHAYKQGKTLPQVFEMTERLRKFGNPFGRPLLQELRKLAPASYFERKGGVLLFPGAHLVAEDGGRLLRRTVAVLEALGVENLALPGEDLLSAGIELLDLGDREGFAEHARKVRRMCEPYEAILCPAPQDAHAFANRYKEFGQSLGERVKNFPEFLLAYLERVKESVKPLQGRELAYHDPCTLARRLETVETPRKILDICGVKLVEAAWHGSDANCCGAGGAYADVFPQEATRMAQARLRELRGQSGRDVVTCSPRCRSHLAGSESGVQVLELVEIVAEALGVG